MIDPVSFLVLTLVSVGGSHFVAPESRWNRLAWSTGPGLLLLLVAHPGALGFGLTSVAVSALVYVLGRRIDNSRLRARLPYSILLLLFVPDLFGFRDGPPILWLGSAFFVVRQMMTTTEAIKRDVAAGEFAPALWLATFFFAALPSGPVFNGLKVWDQLGERRKSDDGAGLFGLFEGFVYLFALAGFADLLLDAAAEQSAGSALHLVAGFVVKSLLAFGFLFATFYGYSRMAEGTALLFGFSVPANFDRPHLARDLGDYWKRWHRSMADFVMQHIYLPLLVTTKQAKIALLGAFVFMGLWHDLSPAFLVWGVGHGVGLGVVLPWTRRRKVSPGLVRAGSLGWVVALSSIAHGVWFT